MIPTAEDLAALAALPVADALEAAEARGLVPVGWSSDPLREWHCVACELDTSPGSPVRTLVESQVAAMTALDNGYGVDLSMFKADSKAALQTALVRVQDERRKDCSVCRGVRSQPATTADLLAVLALGYDVPPRVACDPCLGRGWWGHARDPRDCAACGGTGELVIPRGHDRAEELARRVVADLRAYGHPATSPESVRVVWRVVLPGAAKPRTVWRNGEMCMSPEGHVGIVGDPITSASQLPAARALVAMGLHLGTITDDVVTLVVLRRE